ncbi:MAG: hypothetical protein RLP44_14850 [Aggregatilineales bacterium]
MSELIVSYLIRRHQGTAHGFRVYADGQVESYQSSRYVKAADGSITTESLTPDWYPLTSLDGSQVQHAKRLVIESGAPQMPTDLNESRQPDTSKRSSAEWQIGTQDGIKTIIVPEWVPDSPHGKALVELESQINEIIHAAT